MTTDWSMRRRPRPVRWEPTYAHQRGAVAAVVLLTVSVLFRRPDLLVIAAPLAIVVGWSLVTRPTATPVIDDHVGHDTLREGDATTWRIDVRDAEFADTLAVAMGETPWIRRRPDSGTATAPFVDGAAHAQIDLRATRWGRRSVDPVHVIMTSAWGAFRRSERGQRHAITILPLPAVFDSSAPVRPTNGLVGSYRSVRPGEGSEFAGIRDFQVGDRMRRINWPRSLRSDRLHVNATWADQDTHVALVVDAGDDLGSSGGVDGSASSLDTNVRAAGAIAEHYVQRGDRVSLRTFGEARPTEIGPATGQAHLRRILHTLTGIEQGRNRSVGAGPRRERPMADGLIVMFSPLIAPAALDRAVLLGRAGLAVVVVDTLPDDVTADEDELTAFAWRIRLLERRRELRRVQEFGIPVVRWLGPGSIDQFLRDVARRSAAPRVRQG